MDVIELLLDAERCDLNTPFDVIPSPLFTVITTGYGELLELFLSACPLVDVGQEHWHSFLIEGEDAVRYMSDVTYACC